MNTIQILTDTGSDMTDNLLDEGVKIVPLYITFDGTNYLKQMVDIKLKEFYERMRAPHTFHPKTSLASIQDYIDIFTPSLEEGKDVLYIVMNGKFSSTLGAALNAKTMLEEEFPDRRIEVVDSTTVTYGQYYLTHIAHKMAQDGSSMDDIIKVIDDIKGTVKYFFTVETLDYLRDGGRIGTASALLGGMLNIKPVLFIEDGEIKPVSKVRGRKKSLDAILENAKEYLEGKDVNDYEIAILEGDIEEEASEYKLLVEETLGVKDLPMCKLGLSIGLHAGPGTLGISINKKMK